MGAWLLSLALVLAAQDPAPEPTPAPAPTPEVEQAEAPADSPSGPIDHELARKTGLERWQTMSEEERAVLRERFEALRKLSPEQREALRERARALDEQRRELREGLDPELREHLDRLPPHERDRILREEQLARRKDRGRSLRGSLAPEHREWLEGLVEPGRPHPPEDMRRRIHGHFGGPAIERLREQGNLTDEQQARLEGLEGPALMDELFAIERERLVARVAADGLPEGVEEKSWAKLLAEPSPERFLKRARRMGLETFGPPAGRSPGGPSGRDDEQRRGPRHDSALPEGAPAWAAPLVEAGRPTLADRLELRGLSRTERREAMDRLREARIRAALPTLEGLGPDRAATLEGLGERELLRAVEQLLEREVFGREPGRRRGGPRDGDLGPGGPPRGRGSQGGPEGGPEGRPEGPPGKPERDGERRARRQPRGR